MKILWITNRCLPIIAKQLNINAGVFEGWNILPAKLMSEEDKIDFAIASPVSLSIKHYKKIICSKVTGYCFSYKSAANKKR